METLTEITEVRRLPSPGPAPIGVAFDGTSLWVASGETHRIYAVDPATWNARDEGEAPGEPYGCTVVGDELRVVLGFGNDSDDRYIYRFVPGHGFKDRVACPDLSGAFVAHDGDRLFLSQAHNKKILALDDSGNVVRDIPLERRPVGMTIVDGVFYLVTADDDFANRQLSMLDARGTSPVLSAIAAIPFKARGVAYDGSKFWTTHLEKNEIVAFTAPV